MRHLFGKISSGAAGIWCKQMHPAPMWPIHNHYICPRCQRTWPVLWTQADQPQRSNNPEAHRVGQLQPVERSL